ncbi:MAG TPA: SDR family NAD(P)-dependent oxidoreductase [Candidatus Limnocylindria bacterium]|nr:SDR family NAD(P)-dependent oxidoreductase [Candidatus Limnocylindria bacterium]
MTKVAVVTGAAGGIGSATVEAFLADGWSVVGMDRVDTGSSSATRFLVVDLADDAALERAIREVGESGGIDALVNNAAISMRQPIDATGPDQWDEVTKVNLRAPFLAARAAHRHMRGRDAAIVNVSSVHAVATTPSQLAYASAKAGLVGLTRALALELAGDGIRVNAVLPGAIDTAMLSADGTADGRITRIAERTPLGRIGQAQEVAQAILFLADHSRSSFITGQTLVVDGGALARLSTE